MRKIFWLSLLLFSLSLVGCKTVDEATKNYQACIQDSECYKKMQQTKYVTAQVVNSQEVSTPLALGISNLLSGLSGIYFGRKVRKKRGG